MPSNHILLAASLTRPPFFLSLPLLRIIWDYLYLGNHTILGMEEEVWRIGQWDEQWKRWLEHVRDLTCWPRGQGRRWPLETERGLQLTASKETGPSVLQSRKKWNSAECKSAATVEYSVEVPPKLRTRNTIQSSNSNFGYIYPKEMKIES